MKRVIGLVTAALLVIVLVAGGTWAYFSDTETSVNNTLSAGTLDLTVDGANAAVTTFTGEALGPGNSGSGSTQIRNAGSMPGVFKLDTSAVTNNQGLGGTEFEGQVANLGDVAEIAMYVDVNNSSSWDTNDIGLKSDGTKYTNSGATALDYATLGSYASKTWSSVETMAAAAQQKFIAAYRIPTGATGAIQGHSCSIDFTFTLDQVQ